RPSALGARGRPARRAWGGRLPLGRSSPSGRAWAWGAPPRRSSLTLAGLRSRGVPDVGCAGSGTYAAQPRGARESRGGDRRHVVFVAGVTPPGQVANVAPTVLDRARAPPVVFPTVPHRAVATVEVERRLGLPVRRSHRSDGPPASICAAFAVFHMSWATVTGPTPPGTGVRALAHPS